MQGNQFGLDHPPNVLALAPRSIAIWWTRFGADQPDYQTGMPELAQIRDECVLPTVQLAIRYSLLVPTGGGGREDDSGETSSNGAAARGAYRVERRLRVVTAQARSSDCKMRGCRIITT